MYQRHLELRVEALDGGAYAAAGRKPSCSHLTLGAATQLHAAALEMSLQVDAVYGMVVNVAPNTSAGQTLKRVALILIVPNIRTTVEEVSRFVTAGCMILRLFEKMWGPDHLNTPLIESMSTATMSPPTVAGLPIRSSATIGGLLCRGVSVVVRLSKQAMRQHAVPRRCRAPPPIG